LNNLKKRAVVEGVMARTLAKTRKVGGSLMITIPKEVVEQEDIHAGELVELVVKKARKNAFGIDPAIGPMTREDELDAHS
jgi:antitoxin component of MazEF toxin-antitoxin module